MGTRHEAGNLPHFPFPVGRVCMRFELSKSTPPHLNRRLQLRMLGFVGLICVFIVFMISAQSQRPKKDIPLPGAPDGTGYEVNGGPTPELGDKESPWQEPPPLPDKMPSDVENDLDRDIRMRETQFDKSILRRVKDNTLGIRREEGDAFYRVLNHTRHISTQALDRSGATDVLYINLMTQPDRFRGDPITIHGDLRRLYEFRAGSNPYQIKTLYEAWIFTADSSTHPYRVVFTHLPRELEPGENLRQMVKVTGYFFKREGYASAGGIHVAPTLLARQVTLFRPPHALPSADSIMPYLTGLVSAIGLAFLVTLVSLVISDRRAAHAAWLREKNAPRPSFAGIEVRPSLSVAESLKRLEEQEWQAEADAVDEPYEEVSTLLHARDRVRTEKTLPVTPEPTVDELDDRRQSAIKAVRAWTSQHGSHSDAGPPVTVPAIEPKPAPSATIESAVEPTSGESKLAAWESEIQQFAAQRKPAPLTPAQRTAQADLERDEKLREEELNDRLRHERAVIDQERADLEATSREQLDQDRRTFSLPIRHDEEAHTPPPSDHLTIDRAEREDLSNEDDSSDNDESDDGNSGSGNKWSPDQGRRSSRRQRRRDGR
jgi:hypothetical protein